MENNMSEPTPKMHICENCGFMSTQKELFLIVNGLLQCLFCVEQYSQLLFELKPSKTM